MWNRFALATALMLQTITQWFQGKGIETEIAHQAAWWSCLLLLIFAATVLHFSLKHVFLRLVRAVIHKLKLKNARIVVGDGFLNSIAHLIPAIFIHKTAPYFLGVQASEGEKTLQSSTLIYILLVSVFAIYSLLNGLVRLYEKKPLSREIPITSFIQVCKLLIALAALILAVSILINRSPVFIFSGLGAMTAVLLLIFKDAILGFVAGIQLAANRMISVGDWIEMPKYDADGEVEEIALTTVKVRNWDKTRTTIPTYALISDSFKNWRGMLESGGRRIKRSLHVDMQSIHLMDDSLRKHLNGITLLREYFKGKDAEIAQWHQTHGYDPTKDSGMNGRHLTNVGTYRAYIQAYLRKHPGIHQEMTLIVRQLAPDESGLPLEIYCFTNDIRWSQYEGIQADIFDHLIAMAGQFQLRIYQNPTGNDVTTGLQNATSDNSAEFALPD